MSRLDESRTAETLDTYETPEHVLERVREVFGGQIGLDPFTSERNPTRATYILTGACLEDDGYTSAWLAPPWITSGGVFANPPYGPALKKFADKIVHEMGLGTEIVTLTPARPDTKWYDRLASNAARIADIRGRLTFNTDGQPAKSWNKKKQRWEVTSCQFPCALMYFGLNSARFEEVMSRDGFARISVVVR